MTPQSGLYNPSPNFADAVNSNILRSEIEGGIHLNDLRPGAALSIQTMNRVYELVFLGDATALISGHPEFYRACRSPDSLKPGEAR